MTGQADRDVEEQRLRAFDRSALLSMEAVEEIEADRLYVLTTPEGTLELYHSARDELILWAYTRIAGLVASCGDGQPYARATPAEIVEFGDVLDTALLMALDAWHPEGARYPTPDPSEMEPMQHIELSGEDMASTGVVWIPTRPVRTGDHQVNAELYSPAPGQPLLLVYSSLPALQAACGPHQAAAAIHADQVDEVAFEVGAAGIVFDAPVPEEAQHQEPVRDWHRRDTFGLP